MLKHTWKEHEDYVNLEFSLKNMEEVASYLNNKKAESENISKVNEIMNTFHGTFDIPPDRRYLYEDEVRLASEKGDKLRKIYLFSDVIVISKSGPTTNTIFKKTKDKVDYLFQLKHVSIVNQGDKRFNISVHESEAFCTIVSESEKQKDLWIGRIQTAAKNYLDKISNMRIDNTSKRTWFDTLKKDKSIGSKLNNSVASDETIEKGPTVPRRNNLNLTVRKIRRSVSSPNLNEIFVEQKKDQ